MLWSSSGSVLWTVECPAGYAGKKTQDESALLRRSAMLATRAGMAGMSAQMPGCQHC